jgi:hypothetical protein
VQTIASFLESHKEKHSWLRIWFNGKEDEECNYCRIIDVLTDDFGKLAGLMLAFEGSSDYHEYYPMSIIHMWAYNPDDQTEE